VVAQAERDEAQAEVGRLTEELRLAQGALAAAQAAADAARRVRRDARRIDDVRIRLLLDTLTAAARGLAQELALPPAEGRPGDLVAAGLLAEIDPFAGVSDRTLEAADAALVDRLLAVPGLHLLVDGYNVTKAGYPTMPLEAQRSRLLTSLAGLAARTGAEVTCVFDAANREPGQTLSVPASRAVRVLFTQPGEIADEVLIRFAAAEPPGRPVLVASSDGQVGRDARRFGARVLPSAALLAWLER
ncbi:MAG: NYN domain-containing protein, partial [Mycobacteriales bacterium]